VPITEEERLIKPKLVHYSNVENELTPTHILRVTWSRSL